MYHSSLGPVFAAFWLAGLRFFFGVGFSNIKIGCTTLLLDSRSMAWMSAPCFERFEAGALWAEPGASKQERRALVHMVTQQRQGRGYPRKGNSVKYVSDDEYGQ